MAGGELEAPAGRQHLGGVLDHLQGAVGAGVAPGEAVEALQFRPGPARRGLPDGVALQHRLDHPAGRERLPGAVAVAVAVATRAVVEVAVTAMAVVAVTVVARALAVAGHDDALVGEFPEHGQDGALAEADPGRQLRRPRLRTADQAAVDPAAFGVGIQHVVHDVPRHRVGVSVCRRIGVSVCRCVGPSARRFVGLSLYRCRPDGPSEATHAGGAHAPVAQVRRRALWRTAR
ncbi:hypothetical protein ACFV84_13410 [Kitasatospora sp. NPDC059811]|uniref:hypothetical protein n=1 Tax=Kitasatospora sp. NPDC059811 TaxID=3346957 RepID=UPI003648841C